MKDFSESLCALIYGADVEYCPKLHFPFLGEGNLSFLKQKLFRMF